MLEVIVALLVVIAGLAVIGFSAYMANNAKTTGAVALSLTGLALVVMGGLPQIA